MRLRDGFVTQEIDGVQVMVATGEADFSGLVRSNQTAAFIVEQLKSETTQDSIVDAMAMTYDAPREVIAADVERILNALRGIGALTE